MHEVLRILPFLLVPVLALLFLNLRLSRKLRYPHFLLAAEDRRGAASFLFRNFRAYYDFLLDGLIAIALAFAIVPPVRERPAAVVVDGSRSMLAGFGDSQPLVKALKRIRTDPAFKGAEPFMLVFDERTAETRLAPLTNYLEGADLEQIARRLWGDFTFFAPDYSRLGELRERGYGEVTLLTDQLRMRADGFRAIELGFAVDFAVYPTSIRFDQAKEAWRVALAESGPPASNMTVSIWDKRAKVFVKASPERYSFEQSAAGRVVCFPTQGLYLLSFRGPIGTEDVDLPLLLPPTRIAATAVGPFSERMLSIFPDADQSAHPSTVLMDQGADGPEGSRRVVTALVPDPGVHVMDPARTGGALIATGWSPGADLTLGPSSRENEDLVLAYDSYLSRTTPAFLTRTLEGKRELVPVGTAYLVMSDSGPIPLIPPVSQFFETRGLESLALPPPLPARWPWVFLLALLALIKVVLWTRITGKSLVIAD